jgi:D-alanyl-lipoteichoic acid acyltransferase DltB (MBOAT superfamily)
MNFVSTQFAIFFAIVFSLWLLVRGRYRLTVGMLIVVSLIFYGHRHWWLMLVILGYCLVDWFTGVMLPNARRPKLVLGLGVGFNLAVLCLWKYTPLLLETFADTFGWQGLKLEAVALGNWFIPMGISFYAFSGIAYMVDVYRGDTPAERSLLRFTLFTTFFPHLVAGPILRAKEFLTHLGPQSMPTRSIAPAEGAFLIGRGFFKKVVLADNIALGIDPFFANIADPSTAGVWALPYVYLYALQIYFDFSGYTDIARGLGLWFGFRWPENFNLPYLATSAQDFWRRWHMTLSRFLRDYLYVPLGGSRHGGGRTAINLMITMLLGGLWHGASWSFMIWGGLHGAFLVINHTWRQTALSRKCGEFSGLGATLWRWFCIALTFHAVCFAWCFFRLTRLDDSLTCVGKWFVFDTDKMFVGASADSSLWSLLAIYGFAALAAHIATRGAPLQDAIAHLVCRPMKEGAIWGSACGLLVLALLLGPARTAIPFIYFQF